MTWLRVSAGASRLAAARQRARRAGPDRRSERERARPRQPRTIPRPGPLPRLRQRRQTTPPTRPGRAAAASNSSPGRPPRGRPLRPRSRRQRRRLPRRVPWADAAPDPSRRYGRSRPGSPRRSSAPPAAPHRGAARQARAAQGAQPGPSTEVSPPLACRSLRPSPSPRLCPDPHPGRLPILRRHHGPVRPGPHPAHLSAAPRRPVSRGSRNPGGPPSWPGRGRDHDLRRENLLISRTFRRTPRCRPPAGVPRNHHRGRCGRARRAARMGHMSRGEDHFND